MYQQLHHWLRHYFTPHESNNWKATTLQPHFLAIYIMLLLIIQGRFGLMAGMGPGVLGYATDISVNRVLQLVNSERAAANLTPLTLNSQLSSAATGKAQDMFAKDYWAHVSPTGTTPWAFITGAGYQYIYAGENLAKSFNTSDEVVRAWMNSPTHRANIMKPEYREIGLAVMNGTLKGEETTLVVEEFGTRTTTTDIAEQTKPAQVAAAVVPTETPATTVPEQNQQAPAVGAPTQPTAMEPQTAGISSQPTLVPRIRLSKTVSIMAAEVLLLILSLDAVYIWRHRTVRVGGHTLAHIIFFLALLGAMGAAGAGAIL